MSTADLQKRRWLLFLEQYSTDVGEGWQTNLAARIKTSPSTINKQTTGRRGPSRQTIQLAIEALQIAPDFFTSPEIGDAPHYRDYVGKRSGAKTTAPARSDSPHWRRFVQLGGPDRYGLTDEQLAWVRNAPFRGGAQSVDDYIAAAEMVARQHMPEPPGMAEARRKRDAR